MIDGLDSAENLPPPDHVTGITGPPGAGKSTLVDQLIGLARRHDQSPGVVAVDPSSPFTGGALLGDRIRMQAHSDDERVFIRSMGNRGMSGGLALGVTPVLAVLAQAGFDPLYLETVGVGQSELDVIKVADTVVVVLTPGWGDDVQTAKAGLLEAAHIFFINKADQGDAGRIAGQLRAMIQLGGPANWAPPVLIGSALTGDGIEELRAEIDRHRST